MEQFCAKIEYVRISPGRVEKCRAGRVGVVQQVWLCWVGWELWKPRANRFAAEFLPVLAGWVKHFSIFPFLVKLTGQPAQQSCCSVWLVQYSSVTLSIAVQHKPASPATVLQQSSLFSFSKVV